MTIHRNGGPKPKKKSKKGRMYPFPNFCGECGAQLQWVPVNESDGSVELVCSHCGLVHSPIINKEKVEV